VTAADRLSDAALFDREVPASWQPLLAGLAQLEALLDEEGPSDDPGRRARAAAILKALLAQAGRLHGKSPRQLHARSPNHALWFTEAVLLWPYFAEAGGRVLVDSHDSPTLRRFQADLRAGEAERAALATALRRTFGWSERELARLEATVRARISNLRIKQAITARLYRELRAPTPPGGTPTGGTPAPALSSGPSEGPEPPAMSSAQQSRAPLSAMPELQHKILKLFQRLYGPLPFRPGDLQLTMTSTALIFGLPFEKTTFLRPGFEERTALERTAINLFLEKVNKHKNSFDSLRFPGFGLYERAEVDPALIEALTAAVAKEPGLESVRSAVVAETLATMVTLIPSQHAEMFLVHDLWGHGWEESLCDFEWSYARLIELREPIHPQSGARFGADTLRLRDAFVTAGGGVSLDPQMLGRVVRADLRGRIQVALNVVVAEALADLVEHRYVRRRAPGDPPLPGSSLYPEAPLKTDLSMRDTQTLLKAATRPYRRLLEDPAEARRLTHELAATGLPAEGLAAAVEEAIQAIKAEFEPVFDTRMSFAEEGGGAPAAGRAVEGGGNLQVNLAQRVMLGMVSLTEAAGRFLNEADAACSSLTPENRWRCPRACIDLLVLLLGWFYEQDRELFFWHLDELLREELLPTLLRFERNLPR
jgi:hypothetical protein